MILEARYGALDIRLNACSASGRRSQIIVPQLEESTFRLISSESAH